MEMEKNEKVAGNDEPEKTVSQSDQPNYRGIKAMPFVIGNETFEKLGTIGTSSNLLIYLTTVFHMNAIQATNLLNIFNGTCNIGTLIGAFLSDTYFGRYKTLGFASVSSFLGMLMLTLTAVSSNLHPHDCGATGTCNGPTAGQMTFLVFTFALLVVGASGIRPCNLAFGADQFNPNTESGRRGTTSFFNWYYFTYTFAMMVSLTIIVYVQSSISWSIGLGVPTFLMFLSCVLFFAGTKLYVRVMPQSSPLTSVMQVISAAIKKRRLPLPEQPQLALFNHMPSNSINSKLPYTNQFRFLDKAAIITPEDQINSDGSAANPSRLSSVQQVEEVKCVIRVLPIWASGIIYVVFLVELANYVVFQSLQSNRQIGGFKIPAASFNIFSMLALTIWLPIYDRVIVPILRTITGKEDGITLLQKMGIGLFLSIFAMLASAIVETQRRSLAITKPPIGFEPRKGAISSMSGLWMVPQLAIAGISEAFTLVGQNELLYKQFPENMRSMAASLAFCGIAVASYLSTFISSVVVKATGKDGKENWLAEDLNKGKLEYFYYMIAALEALNLAYFLVCARWYKYKGTDDDIAPEVAMDDLKKPENHIV